MRLNKGRSEEDQKIRRSENRKEARGIGHGAESIGQRASGP